MLSAILLYSIKWHGIKQSKYMGAIQQEYMYIVYAGVHNAVSHNESWLKIMSKCHHDYHIMVF